MQQINSSQAKHIPGIPLLVAFGCTGILYAAYVFEIKSMLHYQALIAIMIPFVLITAILLMKADCPKCGKDVEFMKWMPERCEECQTELKYQSGKVFDKSEYDSATKISYEQNPPPRELKWYSDN